MSRRRTSRGLRAIAILTIVGWLAAGGVSARGQSFANPVINDLEIAPAGSLEWEILDRLSAMHRYDPRDLFRLARMTVLESIATYENLRADLPATLYGAGREGEMSVLWDAAELFYVSVTPSDVPSLIRSRPLLADVEAAYGQLAASLGEMTALSPRGALHVRNIGRLLPVMNALIDAMEADQGVPVGVPAAPDPRLGIGPLREQAQGLVEDLRGLGRSLRETRMAPADRGAMLAELDGLIDLVQGFDRMLADGAPMRDVVEALRLIRNRLWPIQARFLRVAGTPALAGRWRPIRDRVRGLSDRLDQPRVIATRTAAAPRPAAGVDRRLLAQADRAIAALDDWLSRPSTNGAAMAVGSQYREELGRWRRSLGLFREQVAAGESAEALARSLAEIEGLGRRIGERARSEARVFRGDVRVDPRGLEAATRAVEGLRALLPKTAEPARKPAS